MKLLNDFFEIAEISGDHSGFTAVIKVFPGHIIYKGHFPGYPITPGVILIQIVHELMEIQLDKRIRLKEIHNCKFLQVINPDKKDLLLFTIALRLEDTALQVKALGEISSGIFFRYTAVYITV